MAINLPPAWHIIRQDVKNFGVLKTLYDITFRVVNRFFVFRIFKCLVITTADPGYRAGNPAYEHLFLSPGRLFEFARYPEYELPEEFVRAALEKGDECYGIIAGAVLTSYGWYTNKPTRVTLGAADNTNLCLSFGSEYIYMYNGYTHRKYRGQRLHAIGMTRALDAYLQRGRKGLVSYVEANNYSSLKSCYRMGYKDFGKIYLIKLCGRHFIHHSKGCQQYQFRLTV